MEVFVNHGEQLQGVVARGIGESERFGQHEHHEQVVLIALGALEGAPVGGCIKILQPGRKPAPQLSQPQLRRVNPPDSFAAQQRQAGLGSLNALGAPGGGFSSFEEATFSRQPAPSHSSSAQDEDDLFALPMSPRSPEMTKSPFSFAASDVGRYLNEDVGRYMKEGKSSVA